MKKLLIFLIAITAFSTAIAQKAEDLFKSSDVKISWLGLDFSHIKLIGGFSQVQGAVEQSPSEIRNRYFPAWNNLIIREQKKYDIQGMLRKDNIYFDIDQIMELNSKTPLEEMESNNSPNYKMDDIAKFVRVYPLEGKSGIGIAFIVESFNKGAAEAVIHFVAINMSNKEILIYERLTGKPVGIGIRNYWAGTIYDVIKQIRATYYNKWKSQYKK